MRTKNARGFDRFDEFRDTYGSRVRIVESSSAAGPHVWIFCDENPRDAEPSPHLDVEQARRVIDALQAFVDEAPARWGVHLDAEPDGAADDEASR